MSGVSKGLGLAVLLCGAALSGCERSSAVATAPAAPASSGRDREAAYDAPAQADAPVKTVAGKPMWSASRKGSAEENAQRSFDRNGADFAARDVDDFVRKAHDFVDHPPAGTQTITRANGDTLFYDAKHNIFAVSNKDGAPRTMFKPDEGAAYWDKQKASQAAYERRAASKRDKSEG
ncbi:MAG TPA: hypothetical protein PK913_00500 [Phenylobacterium sp.]|nr:hypothetical protein [Phenylobacterium sp.]